MQVVMPKFGLTMEEGVITEWKVAVGDKVKAGDILCEVETDKITNSVESTAEGEVKALLAEVDESVPVGKPIAEIG